MPKAPFESCSWREAIKPQTMGSARSGDWVSLKNYSGIEIIVHIAQGHASGSAITVDKATDVAGTNESTGITLANVWKLEDTPTTTANWTKIASSASVTSSATGTGSSCYLIYISAEELGAMQSDQTTTVFDCVQLELGSSNSSNVASAMYRLVGARYPQAAPAAAITD